MWLFDLNFLSEHSTLHEVSKYGVFSGPYFPAFGLDTESPNAGKYGLEKTPYLDTFHAVPASIHNNYYELFEHNIHALSISTAADGNNIAIFYFLSNWTY